jgi:thiol-disulfide isomerase/thioredoxin
MMNNLLPSPVAAAPAAASESKPTAGDIAWQAVLDASEPLDPPKEWAKQEPKPKEVARFHLGAAKLAAKAAAKAHQFYTRFPDHPKAFRARVKECELLAVASHLGDARQREPLQSAQNALWKEPKLTDDDRFNIRSAGVQRIAYCLQFKGYIINLDEFEKSVRELRGEFPKRDEPYELLLVLAKNQFWDDQMDKARAEAAELAASSAPPSVVEEARSMLKRFERLGKPLAFKFTALDGREVDLERLPGKVVLIDCWATWCPPCLREMPHVKAAYDRFHSKGFEVVGISSDDDRAALEKFVKENRIPWPQYVDGKGELNQFALQFDVGGIPTLWLVDRNGGLRDLNAVKNLTGKIEKLLKE